MFNLWRMEWGIYNIISDVIYVIVLLILNNEVFNICKFFDRYFYSIINVVILWILDKRFSFKFFLVYMCSRYLYCCCCVVMSCWILNNFIESRRVLFVYGSRNRLVFWGMFLCLIRFLRRDMVRGIIVIFFLLVVVNKGK